VGQSGDEFIALVGSTISISGDTGPLKMAEALEGAFGGKVRVGRRCDLTVGGFHRHSKSPIQSLTNSLIGIESVEILRANPQQYPALHQAVLFFHQDRPPAAGDLHDAESFETRRLAPNPMFEQVLQELITWIRPVKKNRQGRIDVCCVNRNQRGWPPGTHQSMIPSTCSAPQQDRRFGGVFADFRWPASAGLSLPGVKDNPVAPRLRFGSAFIRRHGLEHQAGHTVARAAENSTAPSHMCGRDVNPISGIRHPTIATKRIEVVHYQKIRRDYVSGYLKAKATTVDGTGQPAGIRIRRV